MSAVRPYILTIAGFDPSGGAGLIADIKTLEMNKVYGMGICTALTYQNDEIFDGIEWLHPDKIIRQIEVLSGRYNFKIVKIGLIDIINTLLPVIEYLKEKIKNTRIIWDPVLKSSSGFTFHNTIDDEILKEVINKIYLLVPNISEAGIITGNMDNPENEIPGLIKNTGCSVLLKGGHSQGNAKNDILFENGNKIIISGESIEGYGKHGTGCVLSSAIAAGLALGRSLEKSCRDAKEYTRKFIFSNETLLGYHHE
jgi:hydroxymethylpyrimidine/phosphomethylpyrimidine kinase